MVQPTQYVTTDIILENGLTLAQERFAMAYIDLGDAKEAWESIGGHPLSAGEFKKLLESPAMVRRVSALYNQRVAVMQHSARVDVDMLVRELEQARQIAINNDEAAAAIAATMGKAKLHGLLVDRKEVSFKRLEDMTEAELRALVAEEFEQDFALGNGKALEQAQALENGSGGGGG